MTSSIEQEPNANSIPALVSSMKKLNVEMNQLTTKIETALASRDSESISKLNKERADLLINSLGKMILGFQEIIKKTKSEKEISLYEELIGNLFYFRTLAESRKDNEGDVLELIFVPKGSKDGDKNELEKMIEELEKFK